MFIVMAKQITRRLGVDLAPKDYEKFSRYASKRKQKMAVILRSYVQALITKPREDGMSLGSK